MREGQKILQEYVTFGGYERDEYFWRDVPLKLEQDDTNTEVEK